MPDATIDRLQNFFGVAIRQNTGDLVAMKSAALATLFYVTSSKINNWHYPHYPTGASCWFKFNSDKVNSTNTYKPGSGFPLEVVYKIRPVFENFTKDDELQKCLHGKTQNVNESFNGKIWNRMPKTKFVTLTVLTRWPILTSR